MRSHGRKRNSDTCFGSSATPPPAPKEGPEGKAAPNTRLLVLAGNRKKDAKARVKFLLRKSTETYRHSEFLLSPTSSSRRRASAIM